MFSIRLWLKSPPVSTFLYPKRRYEKAIFAIGMHEVLSKLVVILQPAVLMFRQSFLLDEIKFWIIRRSSGEKNERLGTEISRRNKRAKNKHTVSVGIVHIAEEI